MRALYFERHGGPDVLRVGEVPEPVLAPGEALVRIEAAACNFNDVWARKGLERLAVPLPHVSGTEASGVVEAVAPGVTSVKVGDEVITYPIRSCRVCATCLAGQEVFCRRMLIWGFQTGPWDGAYAERARLQVQQLQPKPAHLTWTDAAATSSTLLIAWRMLVTRVQLKAGETVLIWGASGGTGSVAIRLVKLLGGVAIAVTSSDEKEAWCRAQGADHVLRSDQGDIAAAARRWTNGGVDVVFDHVGVDAWETSINALRWGGRLVLCGATTGFEAKVDLRVLWNKQLSLLGSHVGNHSEWVASNQLVHRRAIQAPVSRVVSLEDLPEVQASMERRGVLGKIAVAIGAAARAQTP